MATGRNIQLAKAVGEYLVCAELCRRGFIATSFTGNVPDFDILAIDDNRRTIPIQVKAIRGGDWQLKADRFLDITIKNGVQRVKGKKNLGKSTLWCIFVKLKEQGKDAFFIFKMSQLQNIVYKNYTAWLKMHDGRRPRNPESLHVSVHEQDVISFVNNWEAL
jgi:hypothetical protein